MEQTPLIHPDFNFLLPSYWLGQVDSRPLSLFRLVFSLAIIKVSLYYLYIGELFFSDVGMVPRDIMWELGRQNRFSMLDAFGEPWQVQLFFIIWLLVGIGLLLGYQTRLMTILNFIFILSVHERNTFILNGADTVMRVLSFWIMFIPMGQYYSVDAVRRRWRRYAQTRNLTDLRASETAQTAFAFPIRMIQIQIGLIYLTTFILKTPGQPWRNGSAIHYALQVKSLVLPTGDWVLANVPYPFLQILTYYSFFTEAVFFLFVFIPLLQPIFRSMALVMGAMMHLGIALLMAIPNFSYVMVASYTTLFSPQWVEALDEFFRARRQPLSLPQPPADSPLWYFLNLTRASEIEVIDFPTQSAHWNEWLVFDNEHHEYQGVGAWRQVCAHLPLSRIWLPLLYLGFVRQILWGLAGFLIPQPMLPPQTCTEPTPTKGIPELIWLYRGTVAVFLAWTMFAVVWWNLNTIKLDKDTRLVERPPENARLMMNWTGLWQSWNMFSPYPTTRDGWLIINAKFEDGRNIDLMTGQPPEIKWLRWYWGPHRWKKFTSNLRDDGEEELFKSVGAYFCRQQNATLKRGHRLATLEIQFHYQVSYPPHGQPNPIQSRLLWRHWCFPEYAEN